MWEHYKLEHNTIDAEGDLDYQVRCWIDANKKETTDDSLLNKFKSFIQSGTVVRFFVSNDKQKTMIKQNQMKLQIALIVFKKYQKICFL